MKNRIRRMTRLAVWVVLTVVFCFSSVAASGAAPADDSTITASPWWNNWPRFSQNQGNAQAVVDMDASVVNVLHGLFDEGRGEYFRAGEYVGIEPARNVLDQAGVRKLAWLEGTGDSRVIIGAVHQNEDGSYDVDPATGAPRLLAHYWSWDGAGAGVNPSANKVVWMGVHSYADREDWQGPYVRPNDFALPTYPDGTVASGYLDNSANPIQARLYDAIGARDINGNLAIRAWGAGNNNVTGMITIESLGQSYANIGDLSIAKDIASDWWVEYNIRAARWFIDHGVDGFWIDNYSGNDAVGRYPMEVAFGYWSEHKFKAYLAEHPEVGVTDPEHFEIRQYLLGKFAALFPDADPTNVRDWNTHLKWMDNVWLEDRVWQAYLSFKAELQDKFAERLYKGIKEQAALAGKNPDDILVSGNDVPLVSFGSEAASYLDLPNFEYMPEYSPVGEFHANGLMPYGHAGPLYALAGNSSQGRHSVIWFYLTGSYAPYLGKTALGEAVGYEALMHNSFISFGQSYGRIVGNDASGLTVNRTIKAMAPVFGERVPDGKIGLVHSVHNEQLALTPGGYANSGNVPHTVEFYGWGQALEDLNVPYRAIPDYKLSAKELEGLDVLLLPNLKSFSADLVNKVLTPFRKKGGTIIVVGEDSGSRGVREDLYLPNESAVLYDLTLQGKALFVPGTPGADYYAVHMTPGAERTAKLQAIETQLNQWMAGKKLTRQLQLDGFGEFVLTTLNYDKEESRYFVDFTNVNIDKDSDAITPEDGGEITLKLPKAAKPMTLRFYDSDNEGSYDTLPYERVNGSTIKVQIPSFRVYGSLVIDMKDRGG